MAAAKVLPVKMELKHEKTPEVNSDMEVAEALEEGELSDDDDENELAPLAEAENVFDEPPDVRSEKRYDLVGDRTLKIPDEELDKMYETLGIDKENERHYRFNTLHLRHTGKMKTKDIFEYFSGLEPAKVEWLGHGVCNVVWADEILAARALLYSSVEIKTMKQKVKTELDKLELEFSDEEEERDTHIDNIVYANKLKYALPSGKWRKGNSFPKSRHIIMRYANRDDKPTLIDSRHSKKARLGQPEEITVDDQKNPWGTLAQSWGHGERVERYFHPTVTRGNILDLRQSLNEVKEAKLVDLCLQTARAAPKVKKEKHFDSSDSDDSSLSEEDAPKRKLPRMRADREEEKQKLARMEASARQNKGDLRSRLNMKKMNANVTTFTRTIRGKDEESEDSLEDSQEDWASERYQDIRQIVMNRERSPPERELDEDSDVNLSDEDFGEMLQIEIDNEYYHKNRKHKH